ncbi:MAG: hypothetical protein FWB96_13620 [Defluviitaleaceae bacterium]|nr:hypothetical protein [Defluviitaleaceae bacterium]MCL2264392.1 hypothetical protein [Defluviitaleaceae bacterium]
MKRLIDAELVEIVIKRGYYHLSPKEQAEVDIIMDAIDKIPIQTRATELLEAENDGRVVVLPCKAGDTIFRATHINKCSGCPDNLWTHEDGSHCRLYIDNGECCNREDRRYVEEVKFTIEHYSLYTKALVRGYYITREEADAALARRC